MTIIARFATIVVALFVAFAGTLSNGTGTQLIQPAHAAAIQIGSFPVNPQVITASKPCLKKNDDGQSTFGIKMTWLGQEACGFTFDTGLLNVTVHVTIPAEAEAILTVHEANGFANLVIYPKRTVTVYDVQAATIRLTWAYPDGDSVRDPCEQAIKEDAFGQKKSPPFHAESWNFVCPNTDVAPSHAPLRFVYGYVPNTTTQQTTGNCPAGYTCTPKQSSTPAACPQGYTCTPTGKNVAPTATPAPNQQAFSCSQLQAIFGGTLAQWSQEGPNGCQWHANADSQGPQSMTFTGHANYTIHTPDYPVDPGVPIGVTSKATIVASVYYTPSGN